MPNPALNLAPSGRWTALKRRRLALRWATPKPNQKRMRTQQTKLTPHCFAQPEKISQPGSQPEAPSPSFATAAAWLTTRASGTAQRGIVPRAARTLDRKVCRAQSSQRHSFAFCQHRGHANVSALRHQPNLALKRDVPQAARPLAQRWAS